MSLSYKLFTKKDRNKIMSDFNDIATNKNALKDYPHSKFVNALLGTSLKPLTNKSKKILYLEIMDAYNKKLDPFVQPDSLTAWCNQATEQFGLEIKDIIKMKPGQIINLILIDRNVGEHISNPIVGKKYNPKTNGFTYAKYIHGNGLSGILDMYDMNIVHTCFQWEINLADEKCFWGCIPKDKTFNDYDPKTKVGWRGPAINTDNLIFLPKYFKYYGIQWNDLPIYKYYNFLDSRKLRSQKGGSDTNNDYYRKYIKYKSKYIDLRNNQSNF